MKTLKRKVAHVSYIVIHYGVDLKFSVVRATSGDKEVFLAPNYGNQWMSHLESALQYGGMFITPETAQKAMKKWNSSRGNPAESPEVVCIVQPKNF